jgi:hypothetical protein
LLAEGEVFHECQISKSKCQINDKFQNGILKRVRPFCHAGFVSASHSDFGFYLEFEL